MARTPARKRGDAGAIFALFADPPDPVVAAPPAPAAPPPPAPAPAPPDDGWPFASRPPPGQARWVRGPIQGDPWITNQLARAARRYE